ncbi:alpha/beta hydrolase [Paenibacillus sp. BR2-3]|uniref:alpha/beta fold hydrolase n=1 Tax=Paenibacillus sp. BR2-3 TaxID=3048494 RepID=UPI003977D15F
MEIEKENGFQDYCDAYTTCLSLWPVPYKTIYVSTTFGETHVIISGSEDKPPLLLLHGLGFSSTMWYPNIEGLSAEFCTYCIDIIGDRNKSIYNRKPTNRTDLSEWLFEVINALHLEKPNIAGLTYGGFISLNFASHFPEFVNKVILLCPAATLKPFRIQFFLRIFSLLLFSKGKVLQSFMDWMFDGRYQLNPLFIQQFAAGINLKRTSSKHRLKSKSKSAWPSVLSNDELQKIKVSVLLLVGDKEVIYDPRKVIARAKKWIPRIQAVLIPNVGHGMSMEQPKIINHYILNFLNNSDVEVNS